MVGQPLQELEKLLLGPPRTWGRPRKSNFLSEIIVKSEFPFKTLAKIKVCLFLVTLL